MRLTRLQRGSAAVLLGVGLGWALFTFGVAVLRVTGDSMEPTLHDGGLVLVIRPWLDARLGRSSPATEGDVVVLSAPGSRERVVKRVVATAGRTVAMVDGALLLDGVVVEDPVDLAGRAGHHSFPPLAVPSGHVFVLGDNRLPLASRDSRTFGPVAVADLRGRVLAPSTRR